MNRVPISIHVVSDSLGETGEMVARAAAGQFESDAFRIERLLKIRTPEQLRAEVKSHCGEYCLFFYTLVDQALCDEMKQLCAEGANGVDLLSPAVRLLEEVTGYVPPARRAPFAGPTRTTSSVSRRWSSRSSTMTGATPRGLPRLTSCSSACRGRARRRYRCIWHSRESGWRTSRLLRVLRLPMSSSRSTGERCSGW